MKQITPNKQYTVNSIQSTAKLCLYLFSLFTEVVAYAQISNPSVQFTVNDTKPCVGQTVNFTDQSGCMLCTITSWSWSFPGGTPAVSTLQNPSVAYNAAGVYDVSLTVTTSTGKTSFLTKPVYITVSNTPVSAQADVGVCSGSMTNVTLNPGIPNATYNWSTGSSASSITVNSTGTYSVSITKCSNTVTDVINVYNNTLPTCNDQWIWATDAEISKDVVVDDSCYSYVCGGAASGGGVSVQKFSPNGNVVWTKIFPPISGNSNTVGNAIALDAAGNIYVGGMYLGAFGITFGAFTLGPPPGSCSPICVSITAFLIKLDNNGNVLWARRYCNSSASSQTDSEISGIAMDGAGNITIAGTFGSSYFPNTAEITIGATTLSVPMGNEIFIAKINSAGTVLWAKSAGGTCGVGDCNEYVGTGVSGGGGVWADGAGNSYITGAISGMPTVAFSFGSCTLTLPGAVVTTDVFVVKYDPNGNCLWATQYKQSGGGGGTDVSVDGAGNVYTTGNVLIGGGSANVFTKYNSSGAVQWMKQFHPPGQPSVGLTQLHTNNAGDSYITGRMFGMYPSTNFNSILFYSGGVDRIFAAKYNTNGDALSVAASGGPSGNIDGKGIFYKNNCVWVAGRSSPSGITFGSLPALSAGTGYIAKLQDGPSPCCAVACIAPTVAASANTTICSGQSATISATSVGGTAPYTYLWSPAGGLSNPNISNPIATPTVTTIYTIIVTDDQPCISLPEYVTVTVNSLPTANAGVDATVCPGDNATLTASGSGTYSWSPGGQSASSIVVNPTSTTTYTLSVTNSCGAAADNVTVTVSSSGIIATAGPNSTICSGAGATLTASGGSAYSWSNGATISSISVSPAATATYSVIVSSGNCSDTASATVTVNPAPTINAGNNVTACTGTTVTLSAGGGSSYSWSNGQTASSINVNPTATTTYTVTGTDANGCAGSNSVTVVITPFIIANAGTDGTICAGDNIQLNASGGTGYSWIPSTGLSNSNIQNPIASLTGTTTYTVVVTSGSCMPDSDWVTVVVNPNPTAVAASNVTITQGQSATLSASGGGTYSWSPATGLSCTACSNPVVTPPFGGGQGGFIYCVTVTDANGCTDDSCVTVTVVEPDCSGELYLPNAFSPNNDGENDKLQIYYGNYLCIKTFQLVIYNRWGEKVFDTYDPSAQWDGTYRGKIENTSVFVYYLKATLISGEKINKKGNISLIH